MAKKAGEDKRPLKAYIKKSIATHNVITTSFFGLLSLEQDGSKSKVQVSVGFGQGKLMSEEHSCWKRSHGKIRKDKAKKGSGLYHNQADASLAVRAFDHFVLTIESSTKYRKEKGPLYRAAEQDGKIIYLDKAEESGLPLKEYIESMMETMTC